MILYSLKHIVEMHFDGERLIELKELAHGMSE